MKLKSTLAKYLLGAFSLAAVVASIISCLEAMQLADQAVKELTVKSHITILDRHSSELNDGYRPVKLASLPPRVWRAFVSAEDKSFLEHFGFSPSGMMRALVRNIKGRRYEEGGSTITQQVIKLRVLGSEKKLSRKIKELIYAVALERKLSKEQILEIYLNELYFGAGFYGIHAAAMGYFGQRPEDLSLRQLSILAAIIKAPANYSLFNKRGIKRALDRGDYVLRRMYEDGFITAGEARYARSQPLAVVNGKATDQFRDSIRYVLHKPALRINKKQSPATSLDKKLMTLVSKKIEKIGSRLYKNQLAIVLVDMNSGQLRGLWGSRDQETSQFNRALYTKRPVGKMILPIIAAVALEQGFPLDQNLGHSPLSFYELIAKQDPYEYSSLLAKLGLGTLDIYRKKLQMKDKVQNFSILLGRSRMSLWELVKLYFSLYKGAPLERVGILAEDSLNLSETVFSPKTTLGLRIVTSSLHEKGFVSFSSLSRNDYWMITKWKNCLVGIWVGSEDGKDIISKNLPNIVSREFLTRDSLIKEKAKLNVHFQRVAVKSHNQDVFLPRVISTKPKPLKESF